MAEIKLKLYRVCKADVEKRIRTIQEILEGIDGSRKNETKSSVGDKYETGRAMLHLEEGKNRNQLHEALQVKAELEKIDPTKKCQRVEAGCLVTTQKGIFYLSIGMGKVKLEQDLYYCVSVQSPIAVKMRNKGVGDVIEFNGSNIVIESIC